MIAKLTTVDFIVRAQRQHASLYNYSRAHYINKRSPVEIGCPRHGFFWQQAGNHLSGHGCPACGQISTAQRQTYSTQDFITKAQAIHQHTYDYSTVKYQHSRDKVTIICHKHGPFQQRANHHLAGQGCLACRPQNYLRTTSEYIALAQQVHGKKYDYSKVKFQGMLTKIEIICPQHGSFWSRPQNHLNHACPTCAQNRISKAEIQWLDSLHIPLEHRQVTLKVGNKIVVVDGYDPVTQTVYEFYGDYWHGNPHKYSPTEYNQVNKTLFGDLYQRTLVREQLLCQAGYRLISMWESDFLSQSHKYSTSSTTNQLIT